MWFIDGQYKKAFDLIVSKLLGNVIEVKDEHVRKACCSIEEQLDSSAKVKFLIKDGIVVPSCVL